MEKHPLAFRQLSTHACISAVIRPVSARLSSLYQRGSRRHSRLTCYDLGPDFSHHVWNCCLERYGKFGVAICFSFGDILGFRLGGRFGLPQTWRGQDSGLTPGTPDCPSPTGGGGYDPRLSQLLLVVEKSGRTFESSSKMISKLFRPIFRSSQSCILQG